MCFIHVVHVLNMPMDASLACWALFNYLSGYNVVLELISDSLHLRESFELFDLFNAEYLTTHHHDIRRLLPKKLIEIDRK